MSSVILFADTNSFIQLRDLKDLKWRELFPGVKHVRIMVARAVVDELDKHKVSNKTRQRDRARAALKQIGEARKALGRVLTLKNQPVKITLEIPSRTKVDWEWLSILDPSKPDDCLIAEASTYGNGAAIFSHDSGPLLTAQDVGLNAYEPLEHWHLPDEQSDADKKIALLERQLTIARSTKPKLEIDIEGRDSDIEGRDSSDKLTVYRPIVPPLEKETVDRLVERYLQEHPRGAPIAPRQDFYALISPFAITSHDVDRYHEKYDSFEQRVREFFTKLHDFLPHWLAVPTVRVKTTNSGSVSAINFHVTLETSGGFSLVSSAAKIRKLCPFPEAPEQPRDRSFVHPALNRPFSLPKEPHPATIVWIDRPELGESVGKYGCKDLQPQRVYERDVVLWQGERLPVRGTLSVTAGVNDVPDISETVEVTIEDREEGWNSPTVIESLPNFLQPVLFSPHEHVGLR